MDALCEKHPAAVARLRAAAGLVVVALRTPEPYPGRGTENCPERIRRQKLAQLDGGRAEAVLKHDAERHARGAAQAHELQASLDRNLQRFLKQDVLAGFRGAANEIEMRIRRRQD